MRFDNLWASYQRPNLKQLLSSSSGRRAQYDRSFDSKTQEPDFQQTADQDARVMWLGHASVFLQIPGGGGRMTGILFDPVFSDRCSPVKWIGPKRRLAPPCQVKDLPVIDLVVVSHNHYDHLDRCTIEQLEKYHPDIRYAIPTGLAKWFLKLGITRSRLLELGWWQEVTFPISMANQSVSYDNKVDRGISITLQSSNQSAESLLALSEAADTIEYTEKTSRSGMIRIICTPAQHNSGRGLFDHNKTLWASWVLEWLDFDGKTSRVFFGGDTGYRSFANGPVCPIFKEIAARYGSPHLALLPIASGSVLPFIERLLHIKLNHHNLVSALHCMPDHAIAIHREMGCQRSIGIHWGTFTTDAHTTETAKSLRKAAREDNVTMDPEGVKPFLLVDVGTWTRREA